MIVSFLAFCLLRMLQEDAHLKTPDLQPQQGRKLMNPSLCHLSNSCLMLRDHCCQTLSALIFSLTDPTSLPQLSISDHLWSSTSPHQPSERQRLWCNPLGGKSGSVFCWLETEQLPGGGFGICITTKCDWEKLRLFEIRMMKSSTLWTQFNRIDCMYFWEREKHKEEKQPHEQSLSEMWEELHHPCSVCRSHRRKRRWTFPAEEESSRCQLNTLAAFYVHFCHVDIFLKDISETIKDRRRSTYQHINLSKPSSQPLCCVLNTHTWGPAVEYRLQHE